MDVTRIDQIAIAVHDLDEALAFYKRAFGLTPRERRKVDVDGIEEAMLDVGGVAIQLLQPTRDDSPVARFLAHRGPGLHHLGLAVSSVENALDDLRSQGVELVDDRPRPGGDGTPMAFVHPRSTGGVLIELIEDTSS